MDTLTLVTAPDPEVDALLARHFAEMHANGPPESCHVMTAQALRDSGARVYALRGDQIRAVGALKPFGAAVELKSMHVRAEERGNGLGRRMLDHLLAEARGLGAQAAYLETGSYDFFVPARAMYAAAGFAECPPFGDYQPDPLSTFMVKPLA